MAEYERAPQENNLNSLAGAITKRIWLETKRRNETVAGILLVCTILFLTLGIFGEHDSQTGSVLSESDIKTVEIKTSNVEKKQNPSSIVSSQSKTAITIPTPSSSPTQTSSANTNSTGYSLGGNTINTVSSTSNLNSAPITPTSSPEPKLKGGIAGQITIGPTCPVLRFGPDGKTEPECEDRPYSTEIVVKTEDGSSDVARTRSGKDGYYSIDLIPGTYIVTAGPQDGSLFPFEVSQTVTVDGEKTIQVSFSLDSGIR